MRTVQYEEMLPDEMEEVLRTCPIAYIPTGSLEWHGRHMPYGVDCFTSHGMLVRVAQKYGGVVLPPTHWGFMVATMPGSHPGLAPTTAEMLYADIVRGLVCVGFRVIVGVAGHCFGMQVAALQKAIDAVSGFRHVHGFAIMIHDLTRDRYSQPDTGMDHAAKWETSYMLHLHPEMVELDRIRDEDLSTDVGRKAAGIFSNIKEGDPRKYASAEAGERALNLIIDAIGQKAVALLPEALEGR
jgi:creatinine amidohydrolase